jgi:catechol 2,3-dioxygenase-like lactoylglutathione lyase family enzyme
MDARLKTAFAAASLLFASAAAAQQPAPADVTAAPARPLFKQNSMNVFRRFPIEQRGAMIAFYNQALGLQPLTPINLRDGQEVILFRVGGGQIKLAPGDKPGRQYHLGGINDATGIRRYTLFFPDEAALVARFRAAGYPAPLFAERSDGRRAAQVEDPAGFHIELVIVPGATAAVTGGVEVGINVSDLPRSRAFYRDFAGLQELAPVKDAALGLTKYPFRNGETTISLWSVGKKLPADTGSAGIQYVIGNIHAVDAAAKQRKIAIETPLGGIPGFNVLTVWLNDPDGVTNYFYQAVPPRTAAR